MMGHKTTVFRLSPDERGIVVFSVWQSLSYDKRMLLGFGLILLGFIVQGVTRSFVPGAPFILAGNLLLIVKGYNNKIDLGQYDPGAQWENADIDTLDKLVTLDGKIRDWDISMLDITNLLGAMVFILVMVPLGWLAYIGRGLNQVLVLDSMLLLLPHWITGIRSILVLPRLLVKVKTLRDLLQDPAVRSLGKDYKIDLLVLLKGQEAKVPDDVKIRVSFPGQHKDFLGFYGQVVINEVDGKSYPYFYVVLVARKGYGLGQVHPHSAAHNLLLEFKVQEETEVLVIRQKTTKTSGYHTDPVMVMNIFEEGFRIGQKVARDLVKDATL
jgi:hypothetical protein